MQRLLLLGLNHTDRAAGGARAAGVRRRAGGGRPSPRSGERFPACEAVLLSHLQPRRAVRRPAGARAIRGWTSWSSSSPSSTRRRRRRSASTCTRRPAARSSSTCSRSPARSTRWCWARRRSSARSATRTTPPASIAGRRGAAQPAVPAGGRGRQAGDARDVAVPKGRLSVASVAVDYAKRIFEHFADKTVLCIGAGKMAALVLQHFAASQPGRLLVCNRDPAKAEALAQAVQRPGGAVRAAERPPCRRRHRRHLHRLGRTRSSPASQFEPLLQAAPLPADLPDRHRRPARRRGGASASWRTSTSTTSTTCSRSSPTRSRQRARTRSTPPARSSTQHVDEFAVWHRQREMGPSSTASTAATTAIAQDELPRLSTSCPSLPPPSERTWKTWPAGSSTSSCTTRSTPCLPKAKPPVPTPRPAGYLHAFEKLFQAR